MTRAQPARAMSQVMLLNRVAKKPLPPIEVVHVVPEEGLAEVVDLVAEGKADGSADGDVPPLDLVAGHSPLHHVYEVLVRTHFTCPAFSRLDLIDL